MEKWLVPIIAFVLTAAICVGIIWLANADNISQDIAAQRWAQDPTNPVKICTDKGGIPITSGWDGRLKSCQFKEAK